MSNNNMNEFKKMIQRNDDVYVLTESLMEDVYGRLILTLSNIQLKSKMNDHEWNIVLETAAMIGNGNIKVLEYFDFSKEVQNLDFVNISNILLDINNDYPTKFINSLQNNNVNLFIFMKMDDGAYEIKKYH